MHPWNAVIFDIDDTVYDQMEPFAAACRMVLGDRVADPSALYHTRSKRGMEALQKVTDGQWTLEENYIYRTKAGCADLGITITDEESLRFQQVYAEAQKQIRVTPVIAQVLALCVKKGWRTGIITNGPAAHQRNKFFLLGLDRWIDPERILVSADCGFLKPAKEIFDLAAEKMGLYPEKTMFVGDSYTHDILGAAGAGWQSFWLNRRSLPIPLDCPATYTGSEDDLLSLLRSHGN